VPLHQPNALRERATVSELFPSHQVFLTAIVLFYFIIFYDVVSVQTLYGRTMLCHFESHILLYVVYTVTLIITTFVYRFSVGVLSFLE
jgi:hypothetical protein